MYKQKRITDYFTNSSVPMVNKKYDDKSDKLVVRKGKLMEIDSNFSRRMVGLPYPLSSDDDEDSKNEKELPEKESQVRSKSVTKTELNKTSTSNTENNVRPMASFSPSKTNSSFSSQIFVGNTSQSENVRIFQNIEVTPKKTYKSTFGNVRLYGKEMLETPCKKTKMDILLTTDKTGGSVEDNPVRQEKLHITHFEDSPGSSSGRTDVTPKHLEVSSLKPEREDQNTNVTRLESFKNLYHRTFEEEYTQHTTVTLIKIVKEFLKMNVNQNLLMHSNDSTLWPFLINFCKEINLDQKLSPMEILTMFNEYHENRRFVDAGNLLLYNKEILKTTCKNNPVRQEKLHSMQFEDSPVSQKEIKKLYHTIFEKENIQLETAIHIKIVKEFLEMGVNQDLLMHSNDSPTWPFLINFCKEINLDQKLSIMEILSMFNEYHKNRRFVDAEDSKNEKNIPGKESPMKSKTATKIELNKPSTSNSEHNMRPMASSIPSMTNSSFGSQISGNMNVIPKKSYKCTFGNMPLYDKEMLETPCKISKMDLTLTTDKAGGSVQDNPVRQEKLHIMEFEDSPGCSKTKLIAVPSSNKNEINSNVVTVKRKTDIIPNHLKKSALKLEREDQKINVTHLESFKKLFQKTLEIKKIKHLLKAAHIKIVKEFLEMDVNHQYLLMHLFYSPIWHNMKNFCKEINLDQKLSQIKIVTMYNEYLKNSRFVDTDLTKLSTDDLLELLTPTSLREVAKDLEIDIGKTRTKARIVATLKQNYKIQSTLTIDKSYKDVLKSAVLKHLGYCIKLKENVKSSFDKVYVLQTYSNLSYLMNIQQFWEDAIKNRVVYPKYRIENYTPFKNREQYLRFYEAVKMNKELVLSLENEAFRTVKNLCEVAFKKLQSMDVDGKWDKSLPDYLHTYSQEYQLIFLLTKGIPKLTTNHFEVVKKWLQYLIKSYPKNPSTGTWYRQLACTTLRHTKDYISVAEIIIGAFKLNEREKIFNEIQIYELYKIAEQISTKSSIDLYFYELVLLSESCIDTNKFPNNRIEVYTDSNGVKRRKYYYIDSKNQVIPGNAESVALKYYSENEEFKGIRCEGKLIEILFILFFWDIIYYYYVPQTFISEFQIAPLDMFGDSFYKNRKKDIDLRLDAIASEWSEVKLEKLLKDNWNNYSHEKSITDFEVLGKGTNEILTMCRCIERKVLSKVFGRLVTNYNIFQSGFPELFFWNSELSKCKFVTIQKDSDSDLQTENILWIKHLHDVGAEVEICHVSVLAKKMTKDGKNNLFEADGKGCKG